MHDAIRRAGIAVYLVQIQEAHSTAWPAGLDPVEPHRDLDARVARAAEAAKESPFPILVDTMEDVFEKTMHAWPDRYIVVDPETHGITHYTSYHHTSDAQYDARPVVDFLTMLDSLLRATCSGADAH